MASSVKGLWRRGDGTNLVGIPSGVVGSADFNAARRPLRIAGVREMNGDLFRRLDGTPDPESGAALFTDYMSAMFGLRSASDPEPAVRRRYRSSYLRLLRGWAYDSNSPEGAVLKGWAESRFGLFPTYHKEALNQFASTSWAHYVEEKMNSRFHNNAIFSQLDLLYEFAQWSLGRRPEPSAPLRLYRGVNGFDEHPIVERLDARRAILRLNNLVSFTSDRDIAGCFGDCILETVVPSAKVLFFKTLLPKHPLKGEDEVLAIGGDYLVGVSYF